MMKTFFFVCILSFLFSCGTKHTIDKVALTHELDSILQLDQQYRMEMRPVQEAFGWNSPEMSALWVKQNTVDSSNLRRVKEIMEEVGGYPGKSLVGHSASKAAFYVLQHAPDSVQENFYELIIQAAKNNELDKRLAAMYQDRYLMHKGEPQIYGTQIRTEYTTNSTTGERVDSSFVWPIADTTNIDSVRMWNGMGPLEEYLNSFDLSRWK